jgi:O-antigen/teichoic acid export membrane protein
VRDTEHSRPGGDGPDPADRADAGSVGTVEAMEAAVEGVPGAVSLAPSSVVPVLGGELVLPAPGTTAAGGTRAGADVAADSVRAGLLQAGPLAVAGLAANAANVVVTVLLARMLTTRGYGVLNQLTGMFLIVSTPGSAVIVAVVRRVTAWRGAGSAGLVQRWARRLHRQGLVVVLGFAVVVCAAVGPWLAGVLNQPDPLGDDAILVAGAVWILLCLDRGLLQAHRGYRTLAGNLLVEGGVRTAAMLCLVGAGAGATGAAFGVLFAEVVTAVHARVAADRAWEEGERRRSPVAQQVARQVGRWRRAFRADPALEGPAGERRVILADLGAALVALAMIALLQNVDVLEVGRANPTLSGSYAAVSVSSKALVFGALVLGGYLLPEAAIRWRQGGHALRQLAVTLLILAVPAVALLVVAVGAPHLLLSVVFSPRYLGAESAFLPLVLAMMCLSVTVVLTMYLLAVGRRWVTGLLVVGAAAATVAVVHAAGDPRATARADLVVQALLALATAIGFARVHHRRLQVRARAGQGATLA